VVHSGCGAIPQISFSRQVSDGRVQSALEVHEIAQKSLIHVSGAVHSSPPAVHGVSDAAVEEVMKRTQHNNKMMSL
jgi:hypothetical protein